LVNGTCISINTTGKVGNLSALLNLFNQQQNKEINHTVSKAVNSSFSAGNDSVSGTSINLTTPIKTVNITVSNVDSSSNSIKILSNITSHSQ
jgi:hypothetical protein